MTGSNNDRVAIYKARILKVCGEYKLRYSLRDQSLIKLSSRNARRNWNSNNSENRIGHLLQFPTLTLYNDINLSARFQNYFSHVWEHSDLALLWKIRLKREQNLNHYLLCQIFDNMNYWSFVFLLFFDIPQPITL